MCRKCVPKDFSSYKLRPWNGAGIRSARNAAPQGRAALTIIQISLNLTDTWTFCELGPSRGEPRPLTAWLTDAFEYWLRRCEALISLVLLWQLRSLLYIFSCESHVADFLKIIFKMLKKGSRDAPARYDWPKKRKFAGTQHTFKQDKSFTSASVKKLVQNKNLEVYIEHTFVYCILNFASVFSTISSVFYL